MKPHTIKECEDLVEELPPVRFTFDIADATKGSYRELANQYSTFNGHTLDLYEIFSGDGMYLMHARVHSTQPGHIAICSMKGYLRLLITLQQPRSYYFSDQKTGAVQKPLTLQMIYHPPDTDLHVRWEPNLPIEYMEINLSLEVLQTLLPDHNPIRLYVKNQIERRSDQSFFFNEGMGLSPQMKSNLTEMMYAPLPLEAKHVWVKSKVLELLAQVTAAMNSTSTDLSIALSASNYNRMLEVQKIIHQYWVHPPSISQLSAQVGTNVCYLKRHFKLAFGTTIYAYAHQLRMEKALKLLQQKEKRISEIAHIVGYKHAAHFTTAFKKHYGVVPTLHEEV